MNFQFFTPQGADSAFYMEKARICAAGGDCWTPRHCFGFIYFASLPFRFGWRYEAMVGMNLLMVLVSVMLAGKAFEVLIPGLRQRGFLFNSVKYLLIGLAHLVFMWGVCHYPIADVPAGCMALCAVWLLVIALGADSAWLMALSGLAFGLAFFLRNFYLYPALLMMGVIALAALVFRRVTRPAAMAFILAASLPILSQFALTYRHVGKWAQIDPAVMAMYQGMEMALVPYGVDVENQDPVYGCDGVVDHLHWYTCHDCLSGPGGWAAAIARNDWMGMAKLIAMREGFYFGSYVYQPDIADLKDRIFSGWIKAAHLAALLGLLALCWKSDDKWLWAMLVAYVGAVWGLASILHPENRYMIVVYTFMWTGASLYWLAALAPRRQGISVPST